MLVGSIIVVVLVAMVIVMKWADRRDRAKGHVNRSMGDIRSTMRADRQNLRAIRTKGGRGVSPHHMHDKDRRPH